MRKIIVLCGLLAIAMSSVAEEILLDGVKRPIPVAMKLEGAEEYSGNHLLIAGTNVTATITIKDYYPEWTEWLEGGANETYARYGGRFRHKIKSVIVVAYPGAELLDETAEKFWDGTKYWDTMFRRGDDHSLCYTSPARQMSEYVCGGENLLISDLDDNCCQVTAKFKLNKGDGHHGEFYWTAIVEYEHAFEQGLWAGGVFEGASLIASPFFIVMDTLCGCKDELGDAADIDIVEMWSDRTIGSHLLLRDETGRVFFDKDSIDDGKHPNWFVYWNKDGAVPQLAEASYSKVPVFDSVFAKGGEVPINNVVDLQYSGTRGHLDSETGKVVLHMAAGDCHLYAERPNVHKYVYRRNPKASDQSLPNELRKFWDDPIYGIYTVENTIAHESQHQKIWSEYCNELGEQLSSHIGRDAGEIHDRYDSDIGYIDYYDFYVFPIKKIRMIKFENDEGKDETRYWCDHLTNNMESNIYASYKTDIHKVDTFGLGKHKHWTYVLYGDDEYLAMCAGYEANQKPKSRVCETKDWAFPGYQSWLPPPFQQCRVPAANDVKLASAPLLMSEADEQSEPDSGENDNDGEMECVALDSRFIPAVVGPKYKGVAYDFAFDVKGTNRIEIIGMLSDLNSNVVARAMVRQEFSPIQNTCSLIFDGKEIYESGKDGPYMLLGLVFREYDDMDAYFLSAVSGFNLPNLECTYTDFISGDATISNEGVTETVSSDGLFIGVNVESQVNKSFQLSADILDTEGSKIDTVKTNMNCAVGINQFVLAFEGSKIKSNRKNGPYTFSNVRLNDETIEIDHVAVLYTTVMSDFASYFGFTEDPTKTAVVDGRTWHYQVADGQAIIKYELEYYGYRFSYCAVTPAPAGVLSIPSVLGIRPVACIGEDAFTGCDSLMEVIIPSTVMNISSNAFKNCSSLTNLIFNGNAPVVADDVFADVAVNCIITVNAGSTGWDDDRDGLWCGLPIMYAKNEDPIPQIADDATAEDVAAALSGSKDGKLSVNITSVSSYNAYRAWAATVKKPDGSAAAGAQAVKDSSNAWLSFAIDSQRLVDTTPTNGQMKIERFSPTSTLGLFDFTVGIDDVYIGSGASAENLKKVFGLEGGSSPKGMSPTNVNVIFGMPSDGKVKFTAGPKNANTDTFFMRVNMMP